MRPSKGLEGSRWFTGYLVKQEFTGISVWGQERGRFVDSLSPVLCIIPCPPWLYLVSRLTIPPDLNWHKQKESKNWQWCAHVGTQRKTGARACWAAWKPSRLGPSLCQLFLSSPFHHGHGTRHNCLSLRYLIQLCTLSTSSHTTDLTRTDIPS